MMKKIQALQQHVYNKSSQQCSLSTVLNITSQVLRPVDGKLGCCGPVVLKSSCILKSPEILLKQGDTSGATN